MRPSLPRALYTEYLASQADTRRCVKATARARVAVQACTRANTHNRLGVTPRVEAIAAKPSCEVARLRAVNNVTTAHQ
jgi:hypothetical protein